ncbi:efflux pump antibiotic resistance protein [Paecilomyces variotii]|uniref:Efflux pump antibiotic resistance protein n=1 Tax=Byssochlamys spectabilis TaxID=264951 RepID=A0A443I4U9_BYSSP|nr:efflux pump antibiotic resistance protein [Paecilomyces variotii]KAJ9361766.1 hypothetical protein DTO280E4_3599 [Paecilomyces variotii]RWQ99051.1 efflux pump antibiotic resistance protein [Paecilomyces variotii]
MVAVNNARGGPKEAVDETTPLRISKNDDNKVQRQSSYQSIQQSSSLSSSFTSESSESSRSDAESALLPRPDSADNGKTLTNIISVTLVLLLGEFIANADTTLLYASAGKISSEFGSLQDANWLSTAYGMGVFVAQPMYGKLCDIYGRKALLLFAYSFFAVGCIVSAGGYSMWHIILGRAISGIGGAGTLTVASVIITDLVPKRDIAAWRSYINIAMTLGRSLGGPTGGWLADTIGWRWMFLIQAILFCLAALLVAAKLRIETPHHDNQAETDPNSSSRSKLRRIDFLGISCLTISISAGILLLDLGGQKFPWLSIYTIILSLSTIIFFLAFIFVEAYVAREPIFSLRIIRQPNVAASYVVMALQIMAQVSMMFCIPLYFQVTAHASATNAGAHLSPAVIGNAIGGLIAGAIIKRTGRYKLLIVSAGLIASVTYTLLFFRWNGHTNVWESLYIVPGGFGTGIAGAGVFVSMTSMLEAKDVAMATSGFFFFLNLGVTGGVTASNTVLGIQFKKQLERNLSGPGARKIIKRATSDVHYISNLTGHLREVVIACYVSGLKHTYIMSLCWSLLASAVALLIKDHQL